MGIKVIFYPYWQHTYTCLLIIALLYSLIPFLTLSQTSSTLRFSRAKWSASGYFSISHGGLSRAETENNDHSPITTDAVGTNPENK